MKRIMLRKDDLRDVDIERVANFLLLLPKTKRYSVEVKEYRRTRSISQNSYLWGVCYPTILTEGGEDLAGWTADDLHEYYLGEHFGWEVLEGFGRKRMKPLRRSSTLTTIEFSDFVDFIHRKAAEIGIYIPIADARISE